jgi:hypothetical protein
MNFIVDIEGSPTFFGSKLIGVVFFRVSWFCNLYSLCQQKKYDSQLLKNDKDPLKFWLSNVNPV